MILTSPSGDGKARPTGMPGMCPFGQPRLPGARSGRCWPRTRSRRRLRPVIHEVDEALRRLVLRDAVNGSGLELSFEAPNREWASRRNTPTINVYLYDIREDLERREVSFEELRDGDGKVVERRPPPRRYALAYLVTVWTQRPEDEHSVLAALLACFLANDRLPEDVLTGSLSGQPYGLTLTVALPPPKERSLADVWSALGGELKPSLDLVVNVPFDTGKVRAAGPPVLHELGIGVKELDPDGAAERREPRTKAPA
jgi:Pvc16 N-terminal domain